MQENAYSKLDTLSLPRPRTFDLHNLSQSHPNIDQYYIRYRKGFNGPSYIGFHDLNKWMGFLKSGLANGDIIQIEEGILSNYGGCLVASPTDIFSELVKGHLSGLLLHGYCGARMLWSNFNLNKIIVNQSKMVHQSIKDKSIVPTLGLDEIEIDSLIKSIEGGISNFISETLFEFIFDNEQQIYFVDCKPYPWIMNYDPLLVPEYNSANEFIWKSDFEGESSIYDGSFDIDLVNDVEHHHIIKVGSQAMLSHFCTYNLRKGIAGIIK